MTRTKLRSLLRQIISSKVDLQENKVFIFGSWAREEQNYASDVDVGIIGKEPLSLEILGLIDAKLEESDIPYHVEVVDFSRVHEGFREEALKHTVNL